MTPHALFVATVGEGVFKSLDHGESFRRACDGMDFVECHVRALAVDPTDPATLYLGNEAGVWVSHDGAENWRQLLGTDGAAVWSLHVRGQRLIAGTCPPRLFRSSDGGVTWARAEAAIRSDCPRIWYTRVTCLAADPDDPDRLYAGVEIDGVFVSEDDGRRWRPIGQGLSSRDIHALAVLPGGRLLATTNADLNASDDGGQTWRPLGIGAVLPWSYTRALAAKADGSPVLLLGGGDRPPGWQGAIARSADGGRTWRRVLPGLANSTVWNFATHPADAELIYASSVSGQVYRSCDGGETWGKLPVEFGEIRGLAWAPR